MSNKFIELLELVENAPNEALEKSIANCHVKGLFSLVFHGTENGSLKRAFITSKKIRFDNLQLHSHTYNLTLTVLRGKVRQQIARLDNIESGRTIFEASMFKYQSPLNGGKGLTYEDHVKYQIEEHTIPVGSSIRLSNEDIHTISCSKDAIWIVEEHGFKSKSSTVIGVPFHTGNLYKAPLPFQVNDYTDTLCEVLREIIHNYQNVGKVEGIKKPELLTQLEITRTKSVSGEVLPHDIHQR